MKKKKKIPDNQITVYQTPEGEINIEVLYANKNIWLPQKRMAELFGCSADNISLHLKNIYKEKELDESSTTEVFSVVQFEGKREITRNVTCYSLEAIIAVGYRVNSVRGTQFRQWAITSVKAGQSFNNLIETVSNCYLKRFTVKSMAFYHFNTALVEF
jgi:hypothetical protein